MKRPRAISPDVSKSSQLSPRPLCEGEHVICSLASSDSQLSHAIVISLDDTYTTAAIKYENDLQHSNQNSESCENESACDEQTHSNAHSNPKSKVKQEDFNCVKQRSLNKLEYVKRSASVPRPSNKLNGNIDPSSPYSTWTNFSRVTNSSSFLNEKKPVERDPDTKVNIEFLQSETIDVDAENSADSDVDISDNLLSRNKILFKEAAQDEQIEQPVSSKSKNNGHSKSPTTPTTPTYRRRLDPILKTIFKDSLPAQVTENPAPHPIQVGNIYVHFKGRDRRLDRWVKASEIQRASASSVAAAASGLMANTLVSTHSRIDVPLKDVNSGQRKLTRARRRAYEAINPTSQFESGNETVIKLEREREEKTKVRNISYIVLGNYHINAWYYSPYPDPFGKATTLYICGLCLKYVRTQRCYLKHRNHCTWRGPPGTIIYQDKQRSLCVYEVDGQINPTYCENLCLLGKLFLDHKMLYFDVAPFLFYVVTVKEEIAGFFSKEKPLTQTKHNLACILTFPQHQQKGIGRFLISLSYELSKLDGRFGTPERPLSDLGQVSYRSYWIYSIISYLRTCYGKSSVSVMNIEHATGIIQDDIIDVLKSLQIVSFYKGDTYADTNATAFESIEKNIRLPRLPLIINLLKPFVPESGRKEDYNNAAPLLGKSLIPEDRKRPKRASESQDFVRRLSRIRKSSAPAFSPSASRTPVIENRSQSSKIVRSRFSRAEIKELEDFIRKHGAKRVRGKMNSQEGLPSEIIYELSDKMGVDTTRCRKKLRNMSERLLAREAIERKDKFSRENSVEEPESEEETEESADEGFIMLRSRRRYGRNSDQNEQNDASRSDSLFDDLEIIDESEDEKQLSDQAHENQEEEDMEIVVLDPSGSSNE